MPLMCRNNRSWRELNDPIMTFQKYVLESWIALQWSCTFTCTYQHHNNVKLYALGLLGLLDIWHGTCHITTSLLWRRFDRTHTHTHTHTHLIAHTHLQTHTRTHTHSHIHTQFLYKWCACTSSSGLPGSFLRYKLTACSNTSIPSNPVMNSNLRNRFEEYCYVTEIEE